MNRGLIFAMLALAAQSDAQLGTSLGRAARQTIREMVSQGVVRPDQHRATEATGTKQSSSELPLPEPGPGPRAFVLKNADGGEQNGDVFQASGNIHFLYAGYEVWCDKVDGNFATRIFDLKGNVRVLGTGQEVTGERVIADFRTRRFRYENGKGIVQPAVIGGRLKSPLYVRGNAISGGSERVISDHIGTTTCDLDHPHFELWGRKVDLQPYKRLSIDGAKLKVKGRTILSMPRLTVPLTERSEGYLPSVGQSRDEGYWVRSRWGIGGKGNDDLGARIDYFTRLGPGLGLDYRYDDPGRTGLARVYGLIGPRPSKLISLDHRQDLFGGRLQLDQVFQDDNYLVAPGTRTNRSRLSYQIGQTRLTMNRNTSQSTGFSSRQETIVLSDSRSWNPKTKSAIDLNYLSTKSAGSSGNGSRRRQIDVRLRGDHSFDQGDLEVKYQRAVPIGEQAAFFAATDITPMITLRSDTRRLFGERLEKALPMRFESSVGELGDPRQGRRTRYTFGADTNKSFGGQTGLAGGYNLRFKQNLYSDDTAMFILAADSDARYTIGPRSYFQLRYQYLRPQGYAPLSVDRTGRTDRANFDALYAVANTLRVGLQSSYDLLAKEQNIAPWQPVGITTEWEPSAKFKLKTTALYDSPRNVWGNIRTDIGWQVAGGRVSIGSRFDGARHTWGNFNILADGLQWGKLRTSVLLAYNGYNKQFEARHFSFTYDMHCAEAILQIIDTPIGFRKGTEIGFFIRIKALPFETPFGLGKRGNPIGTGTGVGF